MKKLFIVVLISSVALIGGCKKANPLIGTWVGKQGPYDTSVTFEKDGNFKEEMTTSEIRIRTTGTYTVEGDKLTTVTKALDSPELPEPALERLRELIRKKPIVVSTFKVTGDTFTSTSDGVTETMTREK